MSKLISLRHVNQTEYYVPLLISNPLCFFLTLRVGMVVARSTFYPRD